MSAALLITHRRMELTPGKTHEHVGRVKLKDDTEMSRAEVFKKMGEDTEFKTHSPLGNEAKVVKVKCKACSGDYLRTDADLSKDDNLDSLPKF